MGLRISNFHGIKKNQSTQNIQIYFKIHLKMALRHYQNYLLYKYEIYSKLCLNKTENNSRG